MTVSDKLALLRKKMQELNIDVYVIPTEDFHLSEYTGEYFNVRKYMSGFTGSAGELVVDGASAALFTDGRYFIQAEGELKGTEIALMKMGEEGVPTLKEYVKSKVSAEGKIGFDGRVISVKDGCDFAAMAGIHDEDLVDAFWSDRPALPKEKAYFLGVEYTGETRSSKLSRIREKMKEIGATAHIIMSLDDIAWIYNLRGNDVACNPEVLAYSVIFQDRAVLFCDMDKFSEEMYKELQKDGIELRPYNDVYSFIENMRDTEKIMLDDKRINYRAYSSIPKGIIIYRGENPSVLMKAVKNDTEIENEIKAHIKDGVACTKFMYWLKNNIGKIPMTEISASDYLEKLRREQEGFVEPSFDTICAYNANAAMMHYSATPQNNAELKPEGILLVDSGGQYYEGTTDVTRTFALGEVSQEVKKHFTAVMRGMFNLANAKFLYGCQGINLDILARGPIWDLGIDYKCGTGHGVGYMLNVHEAPNGFRWKRVPERDDYCVLEAGMITTDEPGIYIEGSHGIRIENELVLKKGEKNSDGQFMYFDTITMVPIDLDLIDTSYMNETDKQRLNEYHRKVCEVIMPYLSEEEKKWLKEYTKPVA